jgi:antitoxin CcdA
MGHTDVRTTRIYTHVMKKGASGVLGPLDMPLTVCGSCAYIMRMKERAKAHPTDLRPVYDPRAPKRATNLSINSDLLAMARELDINLSATMETALGSAVKRERRKRWLAENRHAIVAYNEHVEANGVFSDEFRGF